MEQGWTESVEVVCERCGPVTSHVPVIVDFGDIDPRPEAADPILDGTIHNLVCPGCGATLGVVDAPLLLHCPGFKPPLVFLPPQTTTTESNQELIQSLGGRWLARRGVVQPDTRLGVMVAARELLPQIAAGVRMKFEELARQLPLRVEPLASMVESFVRAVSWNASRRMVREHPELGTEEAEDALGAAAFRARAVDNEAAARAFEQHAVLLRRCREIGIDAAFAEHVGAEPNDMWSEAEVPRPLADGLDEVGASEQRYLRTGDEEDFDRAAACWERLLSHPALAEAPLHVKLVLWDRAEAVFARRYDASGRLEDLDRLIACEREALNAIPEDSPDRLQRLNHLGNWLRMRFEHDGRTADMEEAVDVCNRAVEATRRDSPHVWARLHNLGTALMSRYKHYGRVEDRDWAIVVFRQALEAAPKDAPGSSQTLANLGFALSTRYDETGAIEDHEEALALFRQALEATTPDSRTWPGFLTNLGNGLRNRHARTGQMADLYEAIALFRQAVQAASQDPRARPGFLTALGQGLRTLYEQTGQLEDLDEAIDIHRQAVAHAYPDAPSRRMFLNNLAETLYARYERTWKAEDLHEAITIQRHALDAATAAGSHDRPAFLDSAGDRLRDRYNRTGQLEDLEESIAYLRLALGSTSSESPEWPAVLEHLGTSLSTRHQRTGRMEDLQEAIHLLRKASVAAPNRPSLLNRLGLVIWNEYSSRGRMDDLQEAIALFRQAMGACAKTSPQWASIVSNLGGCLGAQHTRTGRTEDLQEAIDLFRQAIEVTSKASIDWPGFLTNLSLNLTAQYEYTGRQESLQEAITASRQAVEATPADSPHRPMVVSALASGLRRRYARTESPEDMHEAISLYREAVELGCIVDPEHALTAAHDWAWWAIGRGAFREASDVYGHAIAMAEALYEEQPLRSGKQAWLRKTQTIYAEAAYCRARLGDLPGAVLALETSRARMLTDALDRNRADLKQAEGQSSEAVASYREALARLGRIEVNESLGAHLRVPGNRALQADEIRKARVDLQSAVKAIRALPGHETFLTPPSAETISASLVPGVAVVYLAATAAGGIALVASATAIGMQVVPLWLDGLTQDAVLEILQGRENDESAPTSWLGAWDRWVAHPDDPQARVRWHEAIARTTRTLWDLAMGPVISLLREHHAGSEQVALISHGFLALLPLHAAWTDEGDAGPHSALDAVAVCYAPSLRTLKHAREVSDRSEKAMRLLSVYDPQPTSGSPLPNGRHEIATAAVFFREVVQLAHEQCSRADVLEAVAWADVCHFSCHGTNNWREPLHSGLLMVNNELLTVEDLLHLPAHDARLAVLSACDTGVVGTEVPNEIVALPAAFLQAGFACVVASLWPVYDISASLLMARFYELWLEEHLPPAVALQRAQIWLRDLTNRDLVAHLEKVVPELVPRMSIETAEVLHLSALLQDPDACSFAGPVHWAAFCLTGI